MVLVEAANVEGAEVYQLLMGRECCTDRTNIFHQYAEQMSNYVYVVVDKETRHCAIVDCCWDVENILSYVKIQLNATVTIALYTHCHADHVGGFLPFKVQNKRVRLPGIAEVSAQNIQVAA